MISDVGERGTSECADRTWHGRHAAQLVVHAAVEVEAHHVFDVLPSPKQPSAVGDLGVARDGTDGGVSEWLHEDCQGVGLEHGVAVDHHDDLAGGRGDAGVERGRFALVVLFDDAHVRELGGRGPCRRSRRWSRRRRR